MDEQDRNQNEEDEVIDVVYSEKKTSLTPYDEDQSSYYREMIKEDTKNKKPKSLGRWIAGLLVVSLVGGASIGAGIGVVAPYGQAWYNERKSVASEDESTSQYTQSAKAPMLTSGQLNPVPEIAEIIGPSVVSIHNSRIVATWMGEFSQEGLGSGVIFYQDEEKVYIISNAHVVEGANSLTVTFLGNDKVPAQIVGYDTVTDIAVVSVNKADMPDATKKGIKPAPLGDSSKLRVGEQVIAIGTPIAEAYNNTVTVGYVSAVNREIMMPDQQLNLIQTDAAINPGNSGGALVGPTGEVIGINTMKLANAEQSIEGMGFAIPINDVKPIVEELMTKGKISRPSLGIRGENLTEEFGKQWEMPVGILVHEVVPGSSAAIAGMKAGDIIIEFDGERITTIETLRSMLLQKQVGDQVSIRIIRGSQKGTLNVKLQEMPGSTAN